MAVATLLDQSFRNILLNIFFKLSSKKGNPRLMFLIKEEIEKNIRTEGKKRYAPDRITVGLPDNGFLDSGEYVQRLISYFRRFIVEYYRSRSYKVKTKPVRITITKSGAEDVVITCGFKNNSVLQEKAAINITLKVRYSGNEMECGLSPGKDYVIGRGGDAQILINHMLVSRKHAVLRVTTQGNVHIKDCGSTNGLLTRTGTRLCGQSFQLMPGQKIDIGRQGLVSMELKG